MITLIVSIITNILDIYKFLKSKNHSYSVVADLCELVISIILFIVYLILFIIEFQHNSMDLDDYLTWVISRESGISMVLGVALGVANSLTRRNDESGFSSKDSEGKTQK